MSTMFALPVYVATSGTGDQVTLYLYDWRDRLIATKQGALMNNGTNDLATETGSGVNRLVTFYNLNNLGQTLGTYTYAGDGTNLNDFANGLPAGDASKLRAYVANAFDNLGRVYQTARYSVDPSSGAIGSALVTNLYYDKRSDLVAEADPGGLVYKHQFDGAGRDIKDSTTDGGATNGGGTMTWTSALSTNNDIVLEQKLYTFDVNSNLIETLDRQRFNTDPTDSSGEGNLDGPGNGMPDSKASRDYYTADYYDPADRPTDSVNVGTNGGTAWTRPSTVPAGSDIVLVNHTDYNAAGLVLDTIDPRGVKSGTLYDMLGRAIEVIAAWDGTQNPSPGNSSNQITTYAYNGNSNVISTTAEQPSGGGTPSQTTDFIYGITGTLRTNLFSNDLVGTIEYPDKTTGAAATVASEQQSFGYDLQGEKTSLTDQNGTTHQYNLDVLGRLTADIVTQFGSGVDQSVKSLGYNFNDAGLPFQQTSYNPSGGTVNQIEDVYNGYGQLTTQYQSNSGAVVVGTTGAVQYGYSTGDNNSRLVSMTYPNGRVLNYLYSAGLDNAISRVSALADAAGSEQGYDVRYLYLGLNTIVQEAYGSSTTIIPGLDYIKLSGESNGDAGDQYTGLDRFGRVADQRWIEAHNGGLGTTYSTLDERQYGYDRNSNVLYMNNTQNSSFSELYHANSASAGDDNTAYDPLNRLQAFRRGTLSASTNNGGVLDTVSTVNTLADSTETYSLDALGNMTGTSVDGSPTGRTLNAQNQITADGSSSLTYDNNGNMLVDEQGYHYVYNAWNQLVQVKDQSDSSVKESLQYDALGRGVMDNNGAGNEQLYYNTAGNVVQEQFGSIYCQYVWGLNGPADLVLRDRNADNNTSTGNLGLTGSGEEEREYVMHDADGNVVGLLDLSGNVTERFCYSPYGKLTVLTASWASGSDGTNYWVYFYQGMRVLDDGTNYSMYRTQSRTYDVNLGTWGQEDPTGTHYVNGANLYQMEMGNPVDHVDPSGTMAALGAGAGPIGMGGVLLDARLAQQNTDQQVAAAVGAAHAGDMRPMAGMNDGAPVMVGDGGGGYNVYGGVVPPYYSHIPPPPTRPSAPPASSSQCGCKQRPLSRSDFFYPSSKLDFLMGDLFFNLFYNRFGIDGFYVMVGPSWPRNSAPDSASITGQVGLGFQWTIQDGYYSGIEGYVGGQAQGRGPGAWGMFGGWLGYSQDNGWDTAPTPGQNGGGFTGIGDGEVGAQGDHGARFFGWNFGDLNVGLVQQPTCRAGTSPYSPPARKPAPAPPTYLNLMRDSGLYPGLQ